MSEHIQFEGNPLHKYFAMIPHMADDDLDLYEYRLYGHYIRVAGNSDNGCYESVRTTAKKTNMNVNRVQKARDSLATKGYIRLEKPSPEMARKGETVRIYIKDIWAENLQRYAKGVSVGIQSVYPGIQTEGKAVYTGIHKKNTTEDTKENSSADISITDSPKESQPNTTPPMGISKKRKQARTRSTQVTPSMDSPLKEYMAALFDGLPNNQRSMFDTPDELYSSWYKSVREEATTAAQSMQAKGITPSDVTRFVKWKYEHDKDNFLQDKPAMKLGSVWSNIPTWLPFHPAPAQVEWVYEEPDAATRQLWNILGIYQNE